MRVLICLRPKAAEDRGGDWIQLQATLPHLRASGVEADITVAPRPDFGSYDLGLIWNTVEPVPALYYYLEARRQNKSVAIMPIHWSLRRYVESGVNWRQAEVSATSAEMNRLWWEVLCTRQKILMQGAAGLLPLSHGEIECLQDDFQAPAASMRLVHYGIDPLYARGNAERFVERFGIRDFILCIGYISPRKNQLNLIRALQADTRPVVFMGDVEEPAYAEYCRDAAAQRTGAATHFLPRQDAGVVADALAAARVHAILSWYDVGPLVALEAAQAACPQVVTTECGMLEYLRDEVNYAEPGDLESIRGAIDTAWTQARSFQLAERLSDEFTWERSAREICSALEWSLDHPRPASDVSFELMQAGDWAEQRLALAIQERSLSLKACEEWAQALQGAAQQAKMLEVWAHELETVNREQKQALDRIFNLPPVRAARYLRKRVSPRSPGTNGNPK